MNKARILGIGSAVLDEIWEIATYPQEDAEMRALAQFQRIGGNVANSLSILQQLGHDCHWCGPYAKDEAGASILRHLQAQGIETRWAVPQENARSPKSCVLLNRATGSRTIVHHRTLPELPAEALRPIPLADFQWIHFEGRHPSETRRMLDRCRTAAPNCPLSLEVEKPRPGIESLFQGPQVIFYSRAFARARGFQKPGDFLAAQWDQVGAALLLLSWGEIGSYGQARGGPLQFVPAETPSRVVDSLGAGDVFLAACIDGCLQGLSLESLLRRANRLAGYHCGRRGILGLIAEARAAGIC